MAILSEVPQTHREAASARLPLDRSMDFYLKFHPARWEVFDDPDTGDPIWLPVLGKQKRDPGVGAVDKNGSMALANAEASKRGWTIVDPSLCKPGDTPDGRAHYVRAWPCRNGKYHEEAWVTPRVIGGSKVALNIDTEGKARWLKRLCIEGVFPEPDPVIIEAKALEMEQAIERKSATALNNQYAQQQLKQYQRKLERIHAARFPGAALEVPEMEPEWEDEPKAAPAPKPPRTRRSKAKTDE